MGRCAQHKIGVCVHIVLFEGTLPPTRTHTHTLIYTTYPQNGIHVWHTVVEEGFSFVPNRHARVIHGLAARAHTDHALVRLGVGPSGVGFVLHALGQPAEIPLHVHSVDDLLREGDGRELSD